MSGEDSYYTNIWHQSKNSSQLLNNNNKEAATEMEDNNTLSRVFTSKFTSNQMSTTEKEIMRLY